MPGSPPAADARRPRRQTRRGRRGGWRARQARERERGGGQLTEASEQLIARGTGEETPRRKECQGNTDSDKQPPDKISARYNRCLILPKRLSIIETAEAYTRPEAQDHCERSGTLILAHINVNSLAGKLDLINVFLSDYRIDVLCLSETRLTGGDKKSKFDPMAFPGYIFYRQDRSAPKRGRTVIRGGGVGILCRTTLSSKRLKIDSSDPSIEAVWVSVVGCGKRAVTVGAAYRPPDAPIADALENLHEQLCQAKSLGKPMYLLGDMNVDVSRPDARGVHQYMQLLGELQLHQLVKDPTHPHPTPSTLDHVITSLPPDKSQVRVIKEDISDHLPVTVSTNIPKPRRAAKVHNSRRWHRVNWDSLCLDLLLTDWADFDRATDVNVLLDSFMRVWNNLIDKHCPERRVRTRRPHRPWVQDVLPELKETVSAKNAAKADWQVSGRSEDKLRYLSLKKRVNSILIQAHRNFNCRMLLSKDYRGFWQTMRQFSKASGDESSDSGIPNPDAMNEFFATVGSRVAATIRVDGDEARPIRPTRVCAAQFRLTPATLPELSAAVNGMKSSRAVGVDGVPLFAIRRCFPVIGPMLLRIVNASLASGVFPSAWKTACIVPIFKSGDRTLPNNFRPISLLSVLSKVTEKIVCNQLTNYLENNAILSESQYAYRPVHSAEDALIDAVAWITNNTDHGLVSSITTLDLSKAFDSVDHGVLLEKLAWYGIPSHWFDSYLGDRNQLVRGGSTVLTVTHGVPQGSILGPILFNLFTNDLASFLPHGKIVSYADDTNILDKALPNGASLSELKDRVEESLSALEKWFSRNSLKMNGTKTDFTIIGKKCSLQHVADFTLHVSGSEIRPSKTIKILGVTIDQTLTWEDHISTVVNKCFGSLIALNRFRHHFTPEALQLIIQAHVLSHVNYCLPVWGGANMTQQERVQKAINFAVRVIKGIRKSDHVTAALRSLGWLTFPEMVSERDCLKVYRSLRDSRAPAALRSLFVPRNEVSVRTTRASNRHVQLPLCDLTATQRSFCYRAAAEWNALTPSAHQCETYNAFKAHLSKTSNGP